MTGPCSRRNRLAPCRIFAAALAFAATSASAQGPASPSAPTTSPAVTIPGTTAPPAAEIVKPITPSKAEIAESAFKKLDATNKGYVDREDVRGLDGFEKAFVAADPEHTGRLTSAQFKKAWAVYTGH